MAKEENAAAVKLRQAGETIEKRARLRHAIEVNFQTQETVPGIEDHEVSLGFLERVPEMRRAESGEDTERAETALPRTMRRAGSPWRPAKRG